ncbi:MAG: proline dehydrogenase family protein [Bacteroidota bacterium]
MPGTPVSPVSFINTEKAFRNKDDQELKRSLWLFRLLRNPFLVRVFSWLTIAALKLRLPVISAIKATIYRQFCAGETLTESLVVVKRLGRAGVGSILDYSVEGKKSEEDFERTRDEVMSIIAMAKGNPAIPYTSIKLSGLIRFSLLEKASANIRLNDVELAEFLRAMERAEAIFAAARKAEIPVYIDAEESWIQYAIDALAEEWMKKYNHERAVVLTTLQMYRWDRIDYLKKLIADARTENYFIGIKLVRGAYLEKENKRAAEMNYRSPIHASKEATDKDFDHAVDICLENIDIVTLCAGTHNENSTLHLVTKMKELGIPNDHAHVYFSQLYGMSDHITYNLADSGYNVTKYLPYGPVESTVPYLVRRAEENTAIAGQMGRELKLILEEKERRKTARMLLSGK